MEKDKIASEENNLWAESTFCETVGSKGLKQKMKTMHMKNNEDMNYNCRRCNKKISAHNKDWHAHMCDECFDKEYFGVRCD